MSDINWVNNLTKRALSWSGHTPDRFIKPSVYIFEKLLLAFHLLPPFLWFYMCLILKQENHRDLFFFIYCRKSYHTKIKYFIKMLNFSNQQQQLLWLTKSTKSFLTTTINFIRGKKCHIWFGQQNPYWWKESVSHWLENVRSKILLSILSFVTIKDIEAIKDA